MYSAIVFLPLLGAIIAGLISIFGASQRHPGGEPGTHASEDGHAHGGGLAHARPAELITSGFLVVSAILSWVAFFMVGFGDGPAERVPVTNWFSSGTLAVDWAF